MLLQAPYDPNDHTDKHDSSDQSVSKHCRLPENKIFEFSIPISHFAPLVFTTDVQFGTQSEQFVEGRGAARVIPGRVGSLDQLTENVHRRKCAEVHRCSQPLLLQCAH